MKLYEVFKSLKEGPNWENDVKDFYEAAGKIRDTAVGSLQAQSPDAFGQGARGGSIQAKDAEQIRDLIDQLVDLLEKNSRTKPTGQFAKDINF